MRHGRAMSFVFVIGLSCAGCVGIGSRPNVPKDLEPWVRVALVKMYCDPKVAQLKNVDEMVGVKEVLDKYAQIGAHMGGDGKLYASSGKEVYIWIWPPTGGAYQIGIPAGPDPALLAQLAELKKTYEVVDFQFMGPSPP